MSPEISILFVCMGNICRSPAAEAIFRHKVEAAGLADRFHIDSAGTISYHSGSPADRRMQAAGARRGYRLDSVSRRVRHDDFDAFDHIVAMDLENLGSLKSLPGHAAGRAKVSLMCDYARAHDAREVPDPYYDGDHGFEYVMDLLEDACEGLLDTLRASGKLTL